MKKSTLITLSAAAFILVLAAVVTSTQRGSYEASGEEKGVFYPELKDKIASIDKIQLTSPNKTVEFVKKGDAWVVPAKSDFPANVALIQKTLTTLSEMNKTNAKTKKPEGYSAMGVEDTLTPGSRGFILQAFAANVPVLHTHIGARASVGKDAFYVRDHGQEQVWQVKGDLSLSDDEDKWLHSSIVNIDKDRVKAVVFMDDKGNNFKISRPSTKETSFELSVWDGKAYGPLPAGRKIKSPYIIDVAAKGLSDLHLHDVMPAAAFEFSKDYFAEYHLFDGLVIRLFYAEKPTDSKATGLNVEKKGWLQVKADLDEAQMVDGKGDKANLQAEIDRINARTSNWAYHIPSYKQEQMRRTLESMLDPIEKKEDKNATKKGKGK